MSTPTAATFGVLLRFDGVLHASDLPVQSFARHLTESLPADQVRGMIAGMRGFLEGKPDLIPAGIDLSGAEDGYQAVELLGRSAGLSPETIAAGYLASRADLAASAWAVDESDGLADLIAAIDGPAFLGVLVEPADPAAAAVLDSTGQEIELVEAPIRSALTHIRQHVHNADPGRILVIGTRWAGELEVAAVMGSATGLVDHYGLARGTPTFRSPDLAGLVEPVRRWCADVVDRESPGVVR